MKKFLLALALYAASFSVYCQEAEAGKDCSLYITDNTRGNAERSLAAKTPIQILNNGTNGLVVRMFKRPDMITLNFGRLEKETICVNKDAVATLHFTDGKTLVLKHLGKLNCEGDFRIYLSEKLGTMNERKILAEKKIKRMVIEYSQVNNDKVSVVPQEIIFTSAEADMFLQTLKCFENNN